MGLIEAILLGLLQGITEFLPVSSSGHLVLARALTGTNIEPGITFEIVVHFGSFCSIVVYYRKLIFDIISDLIKSFTPTAIREKRYQTDDNTKLSFIILLSMIPAMAVGFTMKDTIEEAFLNPFFVSIMLIVTGSILYSTRFIGNPDKDVNAAHGFWMGVAQAFAIIPGISRAGSTISLGLLMGVDRDKVANFSFLMVLPVLAGAMLLEILDLLSIGEVSIPIGSLITGFFTSFVSGYLALTYLIKLLKRDKFYYFSFYCWIIGIVGIVLLHVTRLPVGLFIKSPLSTKCIPSGKGGKWSRQLSGKQGDDQMNIDFTQIISIRLTSSPYHPPLPSVGSRRETLQNYLNR